MYLGWSSWANQLRLIKYEFTASVLNSDDRNVVVTLVASRRFLQPEACKWSPLDPSLCVRRIRPVLGREKRPIRHRYIKCHKTRWHWKARVYHWRIIIGLAVARSDYKLSASGWHYACLCSASSSAGQSLCQIDRCHLLLSLWAYIAVGP